MSVCDRSILSMLLSPTQNRSNNKAEEQFTWCAEVSCKILCCASPLGTPLDWSPCSLLLASAYNSCPGFQTGLFSVFPMMPLTQPWPFCLQSMWSIIELQPRMGEDHLFNAYLWKLLASWKLAPQERGWARTPLPHVTVFNLQKH